MSAPFVADLSDNAIVAVTGDDAAEFLHGQFTNDVKALSPGRAQWNGWSSAKGRLLATFLLVRRADGFLLMLPAEIAAAFAKRLSMFVLRSKVKINDESGTLERYGITGDGAHAFVADQWVSTPAPLEAVENEGAIAIGLDGSRYVAWVPESSALATLLRKSATPDARERWDREAIEAGVATIVGATQEAFVPQMANFELVGGVSFQKGCYPGQEIVARTQYRGILKRRMAVAHVEGDRRPAPGDSVYSAAFGEQSAGTVVNVASAPGGGFDLLVVAQIESLDRADLRWKSPDGPPLSILKRPPLANAS
ncbi:MAG TPA: folate-binding protein [Usitatibacter sp.]|nr:folate-binding protein [Usitatibacter sp.]